MKNLKIIFYLLLMAVINTSCEKETEILLEKAELDNQKLELPVQHSYKSIVEVIESGIDLESYLSSLGDMKKMEFTETSYILDDLVPTNLQFFSNPEEFECSVLLPKEDFEEGANGTTSPDFIDENTNTGMFSQGDILPGVIIHTMNNSGMTNDNFYLTNTGDTSSKALFVNYYVDYLIIDFTANNINAVNMDVFSIWGESNIAIEIFGSSGSLGTTVVYGSIYPTYFGVKSEVPITRITLSSLSNQAEGIDNLSFGTCYDDDYDNDGCLNESDAHPYSNLSETIVIGGCDTGVVNQFKNCSTMADQIDDLIAEINLQFTGDNYVYLHKRFVTKLAQLTYSWRTAKLITAAQRSKISSCAWNAEIPYYIGD